MTRVWQVTDAIISQGSYVNEATISNAVIGIRSIINKNVTIQVRCGASVHAAQGAGRACPPPKRHPGVTQD